MRTARMLATAAIIGTAALGFSLPASSAPLMNDSGLTNSTASLNNVENVRWRGRHHGGWRHHGYRRHYGYGPGVGIGLGLATGAIIGGAIANSRAQASQDYAYCSQRYRSYDPASGTYLNYDGNRYPCP